MKVLVGAGIFTVGMFTQKQLAKFLRAGVAKERAKDNCASLNSRYDELERDHPKLHKISRRVANGVVFFV